ncbi:hypothetical protein ACFQGX_26050 [Nonomuraea dietziae]|uniref:hypothetical protein n=1 Tax=Nonomuraea dietziae TaxID=65515 RepID=UPI0036071591
MSLVHHHERGGGRRQFAHHVGAGQLLRRAEQELRLPARSASKASDRLLAGVLASRLTASSSRRRRLSTWSRCRAISGETTRVGPGSSSAGT